ncbi:hypothetical protein ABGB12_01320 [Actinocorallia sp. B10E7]|uniref:hypothetical protein n=1 Tax=Actinocorallia sp. B10E7 TaxID=3153558 RepID=UPI00325EAA3A
MSRTAKLAAIAAASAAAVAMTAAPAAAWPNADVSGVLSGNMVIDAGVEATCTGSTLNGTIDSNGALTITSASVSGCGVTVTASNLPWSGSFSGSTATINGFRMSAIGCTYGGTLTGSLSGSTLPATVTFSDVTVNKISGFFCPGSATVSATYVFSEV